MFQGIKHIIQIWSLLQFHLFCWAEEYQCNECCITDGEADCLRGKLSSVPACLTDSTLFLYLGYNNITYLVKDSFKNIPDLLILDMQENPLSVIDYGTFDYVPYLTEFVCENCNISIFYSHWFANNAHLKILILRGNQVLSFSQDSFQNSGNLKILDIGQNKLESLPNGIFHELVNLTELYLDKNRLMYIQSTLFVNNINIETLHINTNQIESLSGKPFHTLTKLKLLTLYDNKIKTIEEGTFSSNKNLEMIDLSSNQLQTLGDHIFPCNNGMAVWLDNNPWPCTCQTKTLFNNLTNKHKLVRDPICINPLGPNETLWSQINSTSCNSNNNLISREYL